MASAAAGGGDGGGDAVSSKRTLAIPLIHGHTVELFETQAEVGGTWVLRDPPAASSLYESLQTNTPKHKAAFPGVPFIDALPLRVPHADVLEYLEQYAADVLPLIS